MEYESFEQALEAKEIRIEEINIELYELEAQISVLKEEKAEVRNTIVLIRRKIEEREQDIRYEGGYDV